MSKGILDGSVMIYIVQIDIYYIATGTIGDQHTMRKPQKRKRVPIVKHEDQPHPRLSIARSSLALTQPSQDEKEEKVSSMSDQEEGAPTPEAINAKSTRFRGVLTEFDCEEFSRALDMFEAESSKKQVGPLNARPMLHHRSLTPYFPRRLATGTSSRTASSARSLTLQATPRTRTGRPPSDRSR